MAHLFRLIAARTPTGKRQVVEFEKKIGHCHVFSHPSGLAVTVLSSASYPMRVAFSLINETLKEFQSVSNVARAANEELMQCFFIISVVLATKDRTSLASSLPMLGLFNDVQDMHS